MSSPSRGGEIQPGIDLIGSYVDPGTGTIILQTGDVVNGFSESDSVTLWQPIGYLARPSNPTPGTNNASCQGIVIRQSNNDICQGTRDIRSQKIAGSLQPGEVCMFGGGVDGKAQARVLLKSNGTAAMYTSQGNVEGGASIAIQANATEGISLATPWGAKSIGPNGLKIVFGSSGIQMDANGITLIGEGIAVNSSNVSLGANAINPAIYGPSGVSGVASTSVKIGI